MTISKLRLAIALLLIVLVGQAHAQHVVKRFPCKDLVVTPEVGFNPIYYNNTGITQYIHIQVTRNGCTPKEAGMAFGVGTGTPPFPVSSGRGVLSGKRPQGIGFDVPDEHTAFLYLSGTSSARGTIDFTYMID